MKRFLKSIYQFLPILPILKVWRKINRPGYYKYLTVNGKFKTKLPYNKSMWLYSTHELYIEKEIFWNGIKSEFEPFTLKLWMGLSTKSKVVFDIGANTGVFSVVAAVCSENALVVSFEPVPFNQNILLKNIALNKKANIRLEKTAVSDRAGTAKMQIQLNTVNYINSLEKNRFNIDFTEIEVPLVKLDDYCKIQDIEHVDLIKIDVEGHEESVLNGAKETIKKHKPDIILEILNEEMGLKLKTFFDQLGEYQYYHINDEKRELTLTSDISCETRTNYLISIQQIDF